MVRKLDNNAQRLVAYGRAAPSGDLYGDERQGPFRRSLLRAMLTPRLRRRLNGAPASLGVPKDGVARVLVEHEGRGFLAEEGVDVAHQRDRVVALGAR